MILIAESGSTKCDWRLVSPKATVQQFTTKGYNPFFYSSETIHQELLPIIEKQLDTSRIQHVFFYGAGCSDTYHCQIIYEGLHKIFANAKIEVEHDLIAAARATCGTQAGIACIIGTGSNSCLYDGHRIIDNVSNLGYLLGDEGSGSHLGKELIRAYAYREMPEDLKAFFEEKFNIQNVRPIVHQLYQSDSPNVYLASFSTFYSEHRHHPTIQQLVKKCFQRFVQAHLIKYDRYQDLPVHFVGSIAYYFQDILNFVLDTHQIQLGAIVQKPIEHLVDYHQKAFDYS